MRFALVLSLLIAIIAVAFAIYNPDAVDLRILNYQLTAPLAVVIISTLLLGVVVGILASFPSVMSRGARVRKLEKRVAELEGGAPPAATAAPARTRAERERTPAEGAAETQRLAAETQRMAAEAQRRAAEADDPQ